MKSHHRFSASSETPLSENTSKEVTHADARCERRRVRKRGSHKASEGAALEIKKKGEKTANNNKKEEEKRGGSFRRGKDEERKMTSKRGRTRKSIQKPLRRKRETILPVERAIRRP